LRTIEKYEIFSLLKDIGTSKNQLLESYLEGGGIVGNELFISLMLGK
jgi:hypothetical protein